MPPIETPKREPFVLLDSELKALPGLPGVLRAIADDYHEIQATEASAMDADSSKWHSERKRVLIAEADRIEKEWENG